MRFLVAETLHSFEFEQTVQVLSGSRISLRLRHRDQPLHMCHACTTHDTCQEQK